MAPLTGTTSVCHTRTCSVWKLLQWSSSIETPARAASKPATNPAETGFTTQPTLVWPYSRLMPMAILQLPPLPPRLA